ncbi:MAG: discoidin domain-containing protein [Candidatus Omnitrophota bacterium]
MKKYSLFVILCLGFFAPVAAFAGVNLALDGIAVANSEYTPASYAIDGLDSTVWNAAGHGSATAPMWVSIDLGNVFAVDSIEVFWSENDGLYRDYTTVYNFYTRSIDTAWELQKSGTFIDESVLSDREFTLSFGTPLSMRYAKYEVVGGDHWAAVAEIRIFQEGDVNGTVTPEPASMALLSLGLLGIARLKRKNK